LPSLETLRDLVLESLEELQAFDVQVLDVRQLTDVTDLMVVASARSDRQVKAIARKITERARAAGAPPIGVEGEREGEWVLIDLFDVVVHVMLPRVRDFYQLEKLWSRPAPARAAAGG
jgi:ribosome-associated protein